MSIKGIDISIWQSDFTDFSNLKDDGVEFAICKLSEGQAKDYAFDQHYKNLKANNIPVGAYIFSHATSEAKVCAEVDFAIKALEGKSLDLPIFLDMESEDINFGWNVSITHIAIAFGEAVKKHGYKWGIYANRSWWQNKLDISKIKAAGGVIWCAEYGVSNCKIDCDIWQYADNGKLSSYKHNIDMNIMYTTELLKEAAKDSTTIIKPNENQTATQPEKEETNVSKYTYEYMMERWIKFVRSDIGYLEKRTNSQLEDPKANAGSKNWNKYAAYIDTNYPNFYNGKKNGYAWCDCHVDAKFIMFFGYENALKLLCQPERSTGAGCKYSAQFFRNKGQFYNSPKVGDQIFFGSYGDEGHTGIVVAVNGNVVTTVEGNTSGGGGINAEGDGVYEKKYNISTQYIPGYGRPNYNLVVGMDLPGYHLDIATPSVPNEPTVNSSSRTVKFGDQNANVKKAQELLITKGYSCGSAGADGDFGNGTLMAVKAFQKDCNLTIDGIIGEETWALLEEPVSEAKKPLFAYGAQGEDIKELQQMLIKLGYSCGSAGADGDFGNGTRAAVRNFQTDCNLTVTGNVDATTWDLLNEKYLAIPKSPEVNDNVENVSNGIILPVLQSGINNEYVKILQIMLNAKKYTGLFGIKLAEDGDFGPNTASAVKKLQKDNQLPQDGIVNMKIWDILF